ncbi:MAG: hypothetical protein H7X95_04840, partial [Deltaproteobacteria bacterium]|nr:hypothetical protein [Deltaproteobacteria bacterium]
VDARGRASSVPLLAGGPAEDASEIVRQRLIRRSDAIGWFISRDGTEVRLLIDTDDLPSIQTAIESTAASSGLVLLSGVAPASPLWPEPDRVPRPFAPWLPFVLMLISMTPGALGAAVSCRRSPLRALLVTLTVGLAAAAPALFVPAAGVRQLALWAGGGAALSMATLIVLFRLAAVFQTKQPPPEAMRGGVPLVILVLSILLVGSAAAFLPKISLGTQLWRRTSVFFVEVRGDMNEPVVLREVRRLTDFLRAEAGVSHAWSIADLFFSVPAAGEDFGGIPATPEAVRAILIGARDDAAVRLELAPDHRGALVAVRLDEESGVDRLAVLERLDAYFLREHRSALRRIDVSDPRLPPSLRGLGRGILAADMIERVLRICVRSGRILSDSDVQSIERAARRATLVPVADLTKLKGEIAQEVGEFLEQKGSSLRPSSQPSSQPSSRSSSRSSGSPRFVDELAAQPSDATVGDVTATMRVFYGGTLSAPELAAHATDLHRRLAEVRRRHSARLNYNDILYGADLPTEGVLSEEVRDATLDAMGPVAAVPTVRGAPGTFSVDAIAIGGAPSDQALSVAWLPMMVLGVIGLAVFVALMLGAIGGFAAICWWPVALAPSAPLILFPAVATLPIGVLYLAVFAGALAGGTALAVALAPGRRDQ